MAKIISLLLIFFLVSFADEYDPATLATHLWQANIGVTVSNDSVTIWEDQKGSNDATGAAGKRPLYVSTANQIDYLKFNGVSQWLSLTNSVNPDVGSFSIDGYFWVRDSVAVYIVFENSDATLADGFEVRFGQATTNKFLFTYMDDGAAGSSSAGHNVATPKDQKIYAYWGRAATSGDLIFQHGSSARTVSGQTLRDIDGGNGVYTNRFIGARNTTPTLPYALRIYELRYSESIISTAERRRYRTYLITKYDGLTGYYFSSSGDDNDAGSEAAPWKTFTKLDSVYTESGADTLYIKGGETYTGTLTLYENCYIYSYSSNSAPTISTVDFNSKTVTISYCIYRGIGTIQNDDNVTIDYGVCALPSKTRGFGGWSGFGGW